MPALTFIPIPTKSESILSVLFCCAKLNGFKNLSGLFNYLNLNRHTPRSLHVLTSPPIKAILDQKILSNEERTKIANSCFTKHQSYGQVYFTIDEITFKFCCIRESFALCPKCAEDGKLLIHHMFSFNHSCPIHKIKYLSNCPNCQRQLNIYTLTNFTCRCGYDLRTQAPEVELDPAYETVANELKNRNIEFFEELNEIFRIVKYEFMSETEKTENFPTLVRIAQHNEGAFNGFIQQRLTATPNLHRLAILAPWMARPKTWLWRMATLILYTFHQSRPNSACPSDCKCGQILYSRSELNACFSSKQTVDQIQRQYSDIKKFHANNLYTCNNLCQHLARLPGIDWEIKPADYSSIKSDLLLSPIEVAEQLTTSPSFARKLIQAGIIKGIRALYNQPDFVAQSELKSFNKKYILLNELEQRCGISRHTLVRLLRQTKVHFLTVTTYHQIQIIYRRRTIPSELIESLHSIAKIPNQNKSRRCYTLQQAARYLRISPPTVNLLINNNILKETNPVAPVHKRTMNRFSGSALKAAQQWLAEHLTISEAAKELSLCRVVIARRYIQPGYIKAVALGEKRRIHRSELEKIKNHRDFYVTVKEATAINHMSSKTLLALMEKKGIKFIDKDNPGYLNGIPLIEKKDLINLGS